MSELFSFRICEMGLYYCVLLTSFWAFVFVGGISGILRAVLKAVV